MDLSPQPAADSRSLADLFAHSPHPCDEAVTTFVDTLAPHEVHRSLATLDLLTTATDVATVATAVGGDPVVAVASWLHDTIGATESMAVDVLAGVGHDLDSRALP